MKRGFITRPAWGLLVGMLALLLGAAAAMRSTSPSLVATCPAMTADLHRQPLGPFMAEVERLEVVGDRAVVQFHVWRPAGPVPWSERIRIDGLPYLEVTGTAAKPAETLFLDNYNLVLRNEWLTVPTEGVLDHPVLGAIPPTAHPCDVRFVFDFAWRGGATGDQALTFTFELPDGRTAVFSGLHDGWRAPGH